MTKSWSALLVLASVAVDIALAATSPRAVSMPIKRVAERQRPVRKRAGPDLAVLYNAETLYYVDASIGTPPQPLMLQLATGTSDTWMFGRAAYSEASGYGGYFDPQQSSTYNEIDSLGTFAIRYETPGSAVTGNYFSDDFSLDGINLTNVTMGLATATSGVAFGVMGIGYPSYESISGNGGQPYRSIIDTMLDEGVIASRSYSLYLDDLSAGTGTILFGAYDDTKYISPLVILPILSDPQSSDPMSFAVAWTSLGITVADSGVSTSLVLPSDSYPITAILNSGSSFTVIPEDLFDELADLFDAVDDQQYGWIVPSTISGVSGNLDFELGGSDGAIISVPFAEFAIPAFDDSGRPLVIDDVQYYYFGLDSTSDGLFLLGDTFLRSAYVIYDLDANQIAISQTFYGDTLSNINEIPAGNDLRSILGSSVPIATASAAPPNMTGQIPALQPTSGTGTAIISSFSSSALSGQTTNPFRIIFTDPSQTQTTNTASRLSHTIAVISQTPSATSSSSKAAANTVYTPFTYDLSTVFFTISGFFVSCLVTIFLF